VHDRLSSSSGQSMYVLRNFRRYELTGIKSMRPLMPTHSHPGVLTSLNVPPSVLTIRSILILLDDNCYSDAAAGSPDADYAPDVSPEPRYANMSEAVLATDVQFSSKYATGPWTSHPHGRLLWGIHGGLRMT
jgi:hypothetical protein